MYDLLKIYPMPNRPIRTPSMSLPTQNTQGNAAANTNSNSDLISNDKGKLAVDKTSLIGKNSKSTTPPFLLTFEIYNINVHNCMVDSRASSNVIPLSVCRRLNVKYTLCETHITQLDHSIVKVLGEIKDVQIRMASNPSIYQIIGIFVADILDAYGLFLSRDWS